MRRNSGEDDLQQIGSSVAVEVRELGRDGAPVARLQALQLEEIVRRSGARARGPEGLEHEQREKDAHHHPLIVAQGRVRGAG